MAEFISASHDVVFKALFVRNPDLLKAFLSDILDLSLTDNDEVTILNPELIPDTPDGKMSRLDIHVKTPDRKFNIEMQASKNGFSAERVLYYWCKMFDETVTGKHFDPMNPVDCEYEKLEQTYSINVLGFKYLDCEDYHSSYSIREDKRNDILTDKLSIHIFELPKVSKEIISSDNKQMCLELIKADSEEALEMVRTKTQSPQIQKGIDAVYALNADTILREQIRQREKAELDYANDMATARSEGLAEGMSKGKSNMLAELVNDGILTLSDAAERADMTVSEFKEKTGL